MPKLNKDQIGAFKTPLPDAEVLTVFNRQSKEIEKLEGAMFAQRDRIDRLYAVILHRAFTGDLTTKWRETHMTELLAEMEAQIQAVKDKYPKA